MAVIGFFALVALIYFLLLILMAVICFFALVAVISAPFPIQLPSCPLKAGSVGSVGPSQEKIQISVKLHQSGGRTGLTVAEIL